MKLFNKLYNKFFCVMQWNIGLTKDNIHTVLRDKKNTLSIKWLPVNNVIISVADPFIFKSAGGGINILYEDFSMVDINRYGTIKLIKTNSNFEPIFNKQILDVKTHLSYPSIFVEDGKTYVIPESRQSGEVACYEYDFSTDNLFNKKVISHLPLLDPTILKYNNKYWLFATYGDHKFEHSKLYIYYADSLLGPYQPHKMNPVKNDLNGSRPAGNFIISDGNIYRPAQNCSDYYGKSLSFNKLIKLTETEFEEEHHLELLQREDSRFNGGIHTINMVDDVVVVDGIRMAFKPFTKMKLFFTKK